MARELKKFCEICGLAERLERVRERLRGKGVSACATAAVAPDEPVFPRAVRGPGCGRAMELVRLWEARRGVVVYERASVPQVAGRVKFGELRK